MESNIYTTDVAFSNYYNRCINFAPDELEDYAKKKYGGKWINGAENLG